MDVNYLPVLRIRQYPDSILYQRTPILCFTKGEAYADIADILSKTLLLAKGITLSANQCGLPIRCFALRDKLIRKVFFNPEIIEMHGTIEHVEKCLSYPKHSVIKSRHKEIFLKAEDPYGVEFGMELSGKASIYAQHSIDHLLGKDLRK